MSALLEIAVIALAIGVAALFVGLRVVKALRGGRPSCCSDTGEAGEPDDQRGSQPGSQPGGQRSLSASCADAGGLDSDGKGPGRSSAPRPSYCAGCTGCGIRG